jgi:hypothetical protein
MWWSNCRREHSQERHILAAALEGVETEKAYPVPEEHLFHPGTNALAGTWYLCKLLRRYQGLGDPLPYALAECNAGRANVLKWVQGPAATNSSAFVENVGYPGAKDYLLSIHGGQAKFVLSASDRKNAHMRIFSVGLMGVGWAVFAKSAQRWSLGILKGGKSSQGLRSNQAAAPACGPAA